jgi:glycosyltransferase involved in cell wall biosynthesis
MSASVTVDVAGGPMGGAARFRLELFSYLKRTGRNDVGIIGDRRQLDPGWLVHREIIGYSRFRRVALNNVGFVIPGGERWTLLGNALHFLTESEFMALDPTLQRNVKRQAAVVRLAAKKSDVLIAPCSAMAERVAHTMPELKRRIVMRMHPVSPSGRGAPKPDDFILCPVIFSAYKKMPDRLSEWLEATERHIAPSIKILVTASPSEVPAQLASNSRLEFVGRIDHGQLCQLWARTRAVYFPSGLESFGFPLAEARANGLPVIARQTPQNQEIAGSALCGFNVGDAESLRQATILALTKKVLPDPEPFDPNSYFDWMLGSRAEPLPPSAEPLQAGV